MMPLTQLTTRTSNRAARLNARRYPRRHHAPATGVGKMYAIARPIDSPSDVWTHEVVDSDDGGLIRYTTSAEEAQLVADRINKRHHPSDPDRTENPA